VDEQCGRAGPAIPTMCTLPFGHTGSHEWRPYQVLAQMRFGFKTPREILIEVITSKWMMKDWTAEQVADLTLRTLAEHGYNVRQESNNDRE
jgi:hypothetical protein